MLRGDVRGRLFSHGIADILPSVTWLNRDVLVREHRALALRKPREQRDRSIDLSSSGRHKRLPWLDLVNADALDHVSRRCHSLPGRCQALP